jgi:uncharacterized protein
MPTDTPPPTVVETHVSTVVLLGDRAYKLLKPLDTPFLDNSTRERRLANARAEVALNRRLAPDVYLGLLDIVRDGEAVDHLIEMRRMPADRVLTRLLGTPEGPDQLRRVARTVAAFHAAQPTTPAAVRCAGIEATRHRWDQNLREMAELNSSLLPRDRLDEIGRLAHEYLDGRAPLFRQRIEEGLAREGHGDLLAADIYCLDDGPRILDCLAFDEDLRVGDVLADVAFLVMDVERLAGPELADRLLDWYQEFSAEHHPGSLAHHHIAYRSLVRAKVTAMRATQAGTADPAADEAVAHLDQCLDHLRRSRVRLVLVGGGPGTGKSTIARALSQRHGLVVERSDELRKDLAGLGHQVHPEDAPGAGLYDDAHTRRTYEVLLDRATRLLQLGESVVLDASWTRAWQREGARAAAATGGAQLVELECRASLEVARERVARRAAGGDDPSDATPAIVDHLADQHDPWPEAVACDTTIALDDLLVEVERVVLG